MSTTSVWRLLNKRCDLGALRSLSLKGDPEQMGDECARLFAQSKRFAKLERLWLTYNGIGEAGTLAFARSKHYSNLVELNVVRPERATREGLWALAHSPHFSPQVHHYYKRWFERLFPDEP